MASSKSSGVTLTEVPANGIVTMGSLQSKQGWEKADRENNIKKEKSNSACFIFNWVLVKVVWLIGELSKKKIEASV